MLSSTVILLKELVKPSLINHGSKRFDSYWRNVRPIMGWPRPYLYNKGKKYPEAWKYNWRPYLPEDGSYTVRPLPIYKMGGRDLDSGHVVVRTLGGGNKKKFRWVDMFRNSNEDGSVREEKVLNIRYDPLHTPKIALVADAERMRWIFAPHGIEIGDIIRTHSELPKNPIQAKSGDAHPIGALPTGTMVNSIELTPGEGAKFCLAAGSFAKITNRTLDSVTIMMPDKTQFKIDRNCMCVVGQMSNPDHKYVEMWCPQRLRWLGKRPRSGQWHRKDGWCGRKIRPVKTFDMTTSVLAAKAAKEREAMLTFDA